MLPRVIAVPTGGLVNLGGVGGILLVVLSLLSALATAPDAHQASSPKAKEHYARGMTAMERKAYAVAAAEFDNAFAIDESTVLAWNAARAHDLAGHMDDAIARYETFLVRSDAPPKLRQRAVLRLRALQALVRERERKRVQAATDASVAKLRRDLHPPAAPSEPPNVLSEAATAPPMPLEHGVGIACLVLASASLIAGGVLLGDAERIAVELRDANRNSQGAVDGVNQREASRMLDQAQIERSAGIGTLAAAGALALAGTLLWVLTDGAAEPEDTSPTPRVGLGAGAVNVTVRY